MTLEQMQERISTLETILALSARTCGRHNCNCPGSNKIKKLVDDYLVRYPEFAQTIPTMPARGSR